jgi:hypothetical protein
VVAALWCASYVTMRVSGRLDLFNQRIDEWEMQDKRNRR